MGKYILQDRLIGFTEVLRRTGLTKRVLSELIKNKKFPEPLEKSNYFLGWSEDQIHDWVVEQLEKREG